MDPLAKAIKKVEEKSIERDERLATEIRKVLLEVNRNGYLSTKQQQKEILSHQYQKSSVYSNFIMVGGYASVFAIWQITKEHMNHEQSFLVGALLILSILLFTGFEVYKMIAHAIFFRRLDRILNTQTAEKDRISAWQIAWDQYSAKESRIWIFLLIPTIISGFGAGLCLLSIYLIDLTSRLV